MNTTVWLVKSQGVLSYCTHVKTIDPEVIQSLFGQWLGPLLVLKCQLPSSHKAATRTNLHNITLVISTVSVPNNPLGLEGTLSRLIAYHCSCKSGAGTNRACAHVMGLVIGLLGPQFFKSAKKNTGLMTDISLPIQQQPASTGKIRFICPGPVLAR